MPANLEELEQALGYRFKNRDLLTRAVTHSSIANEIQSNGSVPKNAPEGYSGDNERLEFLGDSILGFVVCEWLFHRYPTYSEGQLSLLKNHLVSAAHLLQTAHRLELGQYLHLGRGEETAGGRSKQRLLVNAVEAIIAAMYLDAGGLNGGGKAVSDFITRHAMPDDEELSQLAGAGPPHDFRAELERLSRDKKLARPVYAVIAEMGPGHARQFTVEARVGELAALGHGSSKKSASHEAARRVCEMLNQPE